MRHRCSRRKLNITDGAHRRALLRHVCNALILREQINTTLPRAKELRRVIEPLITMGKRPSVHRRRLAFARLQNRDSVTKLFGDLGVRFSSRPGGYVRILKNGFRKGDSAPMALVEFVEKPPVAADLPSQKPAAKKAKKSAKKKSANAAAAKVSDSADAAESEKDAGENSAESAKSAAAAKQDSSDSASSSAAAESAESAKSDSAVSSAPVESAEAKAAKK